MLSCHLHPVFGNNLFQIVLEVLLHVAKVPDSTIISNLATIAFTFISIEDLLHVFQYHKKRLLGVRFCSLQKYFTSIHFRMLRYFIILFVSLNFLDSQAIILKYTLSFFLSFFFFLKNLENIIWKCIDMKTFRKIQTT